MFQVVSTVTPPLIHSDLPKMERKRMNKYRRGVLVGSP